LADVSHARAVTLFSHNFTLAQTRRFLTALVSDAVGAIGKLLSRLSP